MSSRARPGTAGPSIAATSGRSRAVRNNIQLLSVVLEIKVNPQQSMPSRCQASRRHPRRALRRPAPWIKSLVSPPTRALESLDLHCCSCSPEAPASCPSRAPCALPWPPAPGSISSSRRSCLCSLFFGRVEKAAEGWMAVRQGTEALGNAKGWLYGAVRVLCLSGRSAHDGIQPSPGGG